jgi:hypothetical protein
MADVVRIAVRNGRAWWLESLYALLLLCVLSLVTLLVGDVYYAIKDEQTTFGPIFDLAWFIFVPTLVVSLLAGLVAMIAGRLLRRRALSRYGIRAIAFCSLAVAVVAAMAIAQA